MKAIERFESFARRTAPAVIWLCIWLAIALTAVGDLRDVCRLLGMAFLLVAMLQRKGAA